MKKKILHISLYIFLLPVTVSDWISTQKKKYKQWRK